MKTLVFLLVLGNLLFYAFTAGYFGYPDNPDAARLGQQVAPERIRVVARGEPPAAAAPVPTPTRPAADAEVKSDDASAAPPAPEAAACLRWERLSADNARLLSKSIADKFPGYKQARQNVGGDASGWWVFIPPQQDKAGAEKKASELRELGVTDYFIIADDGPNRFAISLGVFSSEKGSQERLAELKAKGVRSARSSSRPGKDSSVTLEARGPQADRAALLKLSGMALPKAVAGDCQ